MQEERLKEIIKEFYGDLILALPDEELEATIQDLKLNKKEIEYLGINSAMRYISVCDGCTRDNTDNCFYCIHGYYGSGKPEYVGGRYLTDKSNYK